MPPPWPFIAIIVTIIVYCVYLSLHLHSCSPQHRPLYPYHGIGYLVVSYGRDKNAYESLWASKWAKNYDCMYNTSFSSIQGMPMGKNHPWLRVGLKSCLHFTENFEQYLQVFSRFNFKLTGGWVEKGYVAVHRCYGYLLTIRFKGQSSCITYYLKMR